jgi:hypothetical protein
MFSLCLVATVVAVVTVGVFDAVLLLPTPSLVAWSILGALAGTLIPVPVARASIPLNRLTEIAGLLAIVGFGGLAVVRSTLQATAMALYVSAPPTAAGDRRLELAAKADPGSYRIHMRLAEFYLDSHNCNRARVHARDARSLFPSAPAPHHVLAECGGATR